MDPGPASRGMARGTIAMSSLRAAASISWSEVRVSDCLDRSMSRAVRRRRSPPATLKAARLTPRRSQPTPPPSAKKETTTKKMRVALRAAFSRFCGESLRVSARKIGTRPMGSTTKKKAEIDTRKKLAASTSMGDRGLRGRMAPGRDLQASENFGRGPLSEARPRHLSAQRVELPEHPLSGTALLEQGHDGLGQRVRRKRLLKKLRDGGFSQKNVHDASVGKADETPGQEKGEGMGPVYRHLRAEREGGLERGGPRADDGGVRGPEE